SIDNMINGIEQSKSKPFEKVLFALGIRHIGETVAKKLAQHFKNIDAIRSANVEDILSVQDIGLRIADSINAFLSNPEHWEEIERLKASGLQFETEEKEVIFAGDELA